jgi:hypothetical protein
VTLTLSEREVVSATAWCAPGNDGGRQREIQIEL